MTLVSNCCGAEMQPEDSRCPDCKDGAVPEECLEDNSDVKELIQGIIGFSLIFLLIITIQFI